MPKQGSSVADVKTQIAGKLALIGAMMVIALTSICDAATIYTDDVAFNSARSLAMGAANIVLHDGNAAHLSNPAALTQIPRTMATGGVSIEHISEQRLDGDVQDIDNAQYYLAPFRSQGFVLPYRGELTTALSRGLSWDYTTKQETVEEDVPKYSYDNQGGLYTYSASVAKQLTPKWAVGGSLNVLKGSSNREARTTQSEMTYLQTRERTESGTSISLGGLYTYSAQLDIGAAYTTKSEITRKQTEQDIWDGEIVDTEHSRSKWTYPAVMGAGVAYRHDKTLFIGEIHRTNWSDFKSVITGQSAMEYNYLNLTTFHLGVEYETSLPSISPKPVLLRGGFYTQPFYFLTEFGTDESTGYFLTGGIGLDFQDVLLDIAAQFGKRTFTKFEAESDYEATVIDVLATVHYQFDMFQ